jgi:hypothetical protein
MFASAYKKIFSLVLCFGSASAVAEPITHVAKLDKNHNQSASLKHSGAKNVPTKKE